MKSKMLGALALFTLIGALFVMQSAEQHAPTADAATGSIAAINVGTCLTTNTDVFSGDCDSLDEDSEGKVREDIAQVSTLYATYAHDPKTASDEPRAILTASDLIKISISDPGRDKRTGVLIRGASNKDDIKDDDTAGLLGNIIRKDLEKDELDFETHDPDSDPTKGDNDVIKFSSETDEKTGIQVYQGGDKKASSIGSSGNFTLNFKRAGKDADNNDWQFDPADFDVENGAVVRFYGCVTAENKGCDDDKDPGTTDDVKVLSELSVDEDASNGNAAGDTPPWLGVNAGVPADTDIVILAIYYRTSNAENLVGGQVHYYCADDKHTLNEDDDVWTCDDPATDDVEVDAASSRDGETNVVYTSNEKDDNDALLVRVKSDGDDTSQNLWLKETGRFKGIYQGHVRLTDANGDGSADEDDASTTDVDETDSMDWGLETEDATGDTDADAAVIGVESGPVTIEYRDSDGNTQTLRIEIDNTPPAIMIAAPDNGSSSSDQTPDFAGTIEDTDSGLADKSFRLAVDNIADNDDYVLDMPDASDVKGPDAGVSHNGDYTGYDDANGKSTFGIVEASALYDQEDDSCDDHDSCYIEAEAYDDGANRGTFDDSLRLDLQDGTGPNSEGVDTRDREFKIDFQAFVIDMAGNIGFSDADAANPRFINDLGKKLADRSSSTRHNIIGYYSAHIITLDEKDPVINADESATGYFGRNSNDDPVADRSSVMVVFDGPIASSSVSESTFSVELDDGSDANVVDVDVDDKYVFLKLGAELASDATPKVDIAQGEKVEDMAGNETFGKEVDAFDAKDGISPKLTVTLAGGSGGGTGDEGPEQLTKDQITVHVSSDEALQGAPRIAVVCSSLRWNQDADAEEEENEIDSRHDIDDFVSNRNGSFYGKPSETPVKTTPRSSNTDASGSYEYTCGYDSNDDNFSDDFGLTEVSALSRPGENWEYTWQNRSGGIGMLQDGALTAVVFARDRSRYSTQNWGSASAEFTFDTELKSPLESSGGEVQPEPDGKSKEARPFVLIEFAESTTVTMDSVELDNVEVTGEFEAPEYNRFVYWPASISQGEHEIKVEATDAAGNEQTFEFSFTVEERGDFMINLLAGWNAISVPADPVDTTIGSVFTDPAVTTVIGWDTQGWRIAVRRDGVWESNDKYGALNEIRAKYGYWVQSDSFIRQPIALTTNDRGIGGPRTPLAIDTKGGWNFVGVIDQDGDQTEDHFGNTLLDSQDRAISASDYLGSGYVRAYTWDATFSNFDVLRPDDAMTIGDGIWVYYEGGIAP